MQRMLAIALLVLASACRLDERDDVIEVAKGATSHLEPGNLHAGPLGVGASAAWVQSVIPYVDHSDTVVAVVESCPDVTVVPWETLPQSIWTYVTIPPDDYDFVSAYLDVVFTPSAVGFQSCSVTIEMGSGLDHVFTVDGTGVSPVLSAPDSLEVEGLFGGATSFLFDVVDTSGVPPDLTGIAAESLSGELTIVTPPLATVAPGASTSVEVAFAPTQRGYREGTLRVTATGDGIDGVEDIDFVGYGTTSIYPGGGPYVGSPRHLHFYDAGFTESIELRVIGEQPVTVTALTITGSGAGAYAITSAPATPFVLAPGDAQSISVQCLDDAPAAAAHLEAANDSPDAPVVVVPLTCGDRADIDAWPPAFDPTTVGDTTVETVAISSEDDLPLYLFSISLTGDPELSIEPQGPVELAPNGGFLGVPVTFAPTTAGNYIATLHIESNNSVGTHFRHIQIQASAVDGQPEITLLPPAIQWNPSFGEVLAGTTSPAKIIGVRNDGEEPLVVSSVWLQDTDADEFVLSGPAAVTLQPGESEQWEVQCAPQGTGERWAAIAFASNDVSEPVAVRDLYCVGVDELPPDAGAPPDAAPALDAAAPAPDAGAPEPEPDAGGSMAEGGGGGCATSDPRTAAPLLGLLLVAALARFRARSSRPTRRADRR